MDLADIENRLAFIREAERLKNALRSAYTSEGRRESTAEHSWRLCLMAMVFEDRLRTLDFAKELKICVLHDLGEAINGDIPAVNQQAVPDKSERERRDLLALMQPLAQQIRDELLSLWEEYESASSPEAQALKALDKLETLIQHNQGANPPDFDYVFNLSYGQKYTSVIRYSLKSVQLSTATRSEGQTRVKGPRMGKMVRALILGYSKLHNPINLVKLYHR